jgi:hypothetical protein
MMYMIYAFVAGAGLDVDPLSVEAAHLMQNAAKQNKCTRAKSREMVTQDL